MNFIEDWLLNKFAGKVAARGAVTVAAALLAPAAQAALAKVGVSYRVDPAILATGLIAGAHWIFDAYKSWRSGTPLGNLAAQAALAAKAP